MAITSPAPAVRQIDMMHHRVKHDSSYTLLVKQLIQPLALQGTKATGKVLRVNMGPQPRGRAPDSLDGPSHVSLQEGVKGQAITAAPVAEPAVASAASVPAGAAGGGAAGGGLGRVSGSGSAGPPALKVKRLELEVLARYQVGGALGHPMLALLAQTGLCCSVCSGWLQCAVSGAGYLQCLLLTSLLPLHLLPAWLPGCSQEINDSDSLCSTPPPVSQEALLRGSSAFNPAFGPLTPKPLSPSLLCTSGADWAAWADVPLPDMRECMSPQLPAST
jgi:hypothetical protein